MSGWIDIMYLSKEDIVNSIEDMRQTRIGDYL